VENAISSQNIYKSIKLENSITSGSFDIAEYEKDFISYSFYNPYIALSLNIINNKSLATQYFIYGIINLIHSSISKHKISEIKDKPNFFNNKVPDNLSDLSSWNSFLSSFKDYNEDNILFLDSIFTMQYLMENLKQKEPEFYQKLLENSTIYENSANVMEENWLKKNKKNDIFHFLFYQYVSYCQDEKSPILFYSQGFDMDSLFNETINECNTSKNNTNNNASSNISKDKAKLYNFAKVLYNFAYNKFYLQRIQILKIINRANKYFYPFLFEQQY